MVNPLGPVAAFTPWNFPVNQVVQMVNFGGGLFPFWSRPPRRLHRASHADQIWMRVFRPACWAWFYN
jgi:hypothetical protein